MTEVAPGSIAAMAGIKPGSVILQVNRKKVSNAGDFKRALRESSTDKKVLLLVKTDDFQRYIVLNW